MNTAKQTAQKIAKQIAQEPLEILKNAREQITGEKLSQPQENFQPTSETKQEDPNIKVRQEMQSQRMLGALNQELMEIQRQNLFKELQKKISMGEEIYLEDQNELTSEQKEVLKAQQEAMKKQAEYYKNNNAKSFGSLFGSSKPSRRMGGQKQQAQKEQTRVEKPVPPSG